MHEFTINNRAKFCAQDVRLGTELSQTSLHQNAIIEMRVPRILGVLAGAVDFSGIKEF